MAQASLPALRDSRKLFLQPNKYRPSPALIGAEQDRSPEFLRLANALSALYPRGSEEKRLLDAMLLAAPR